MLCGTRHVAYNSITTPGGALTSQQYAISVLYTSSDRIFVCCFTMTGFRIITGADLDADFNKISRRIYTELQATEIFCT
jgi:hypothetical protein